MTECDDKDGIRIPDTYLPDTIRVGDHVKVQRVAEDRVAGIDEFTYLVTHQDRSTGAYYGIVLSKRAVI